VTQSKDLEHIAPDQRTNLVEMEQISIAVCGNGGWRKELLGIAAGYKH